MNEAFRNRAARVEARPKLDWTSQVLLACQAMGRGWLGTDATPLA